MIESWLAAHELEFWVSGAVIAFCIIVVTPYWIADVWRERAKKKRDGLL